MCALNHVPILSPCSYISSSYIFSRKLQLLSNHFHLRHFQWWSMPQKLAFLSQHQKKYFKATLASSKVTPFNFTPDMEFLCLSEALPYLTNATPEIKPRGFLLQSTAPSKGLKRSFRIFSPSLWEQWQDQKSLHFIYLLCASCSLLAHGEEWWPPLYLPCVSAAGWTSQALLLSRHFGSSANKISIALNYTLAPSCSLPLWH